MLSTIYSNVITLIKTALHTLIRLLVAFYQQKRASIYEGTKCVSHIKMLISFYYILKIIILFIRWNNNFLFTLIYIKFIEQIYF